MIGTGNFEGAATRAFENKATLSVGEMEQHGALSDLGEN